MGSRLRILVPVATLAVIVSAVLVAISGDDTSPGDPVADSASAVDLATIEGGQARDFGPAPDVPAGPWPDATVTVINQIIESLVVEASPVAQITELGTSGDARLGWVVADLLRFVTGGASNQALVAAAQNLLPGLEVDAFNTWGGTTDQLIAWDLPVPEDQYLDFKRNLYGRIEPKWVELFTDDADIDWRHVSWGGVGIDDRDFGSDAACRCIPALDDPAVTTAAEGDWYPDDALVFGVVVGDEARAYPKNIMEVHEMVNDTLGGRNIGMPYCTLCGAAQAYFTDELPAALAEEFGRPVFRTSGLLIRSNKMMFERNSRSFIDTFQGDASSGPLHDEGVVFDQVSVVTSTWGAWKAAHPDTTIVAEDGGIGRSYELDPLAGRDDNGPIFPIGDVDPRLPVQEAVLGVLTDGGRPIAFHVEAAAGILSGGDSIVIEGIELRLDGGGIRAFRNGEDAGGHQAFWFAWSQFYPDTAVWPLDYQSGG